MPFPSSDPALAGALMKLYLGANGGASPPPGMSPSANPPPLTPYDTDQNQEPAFDDAPQAPEMWVPCVDPALLKKPSELHIEEAEKYVTAWMKHSADVIEDKIPLWSLLEDLYYNRRRLNEWNDQFLGPAAALASNRAARRSIKKLDWRSQFVISCAPFVDNYVQSMHQRIFASKDYFTVDVRPKNGPSIEDPEFPTARKVQRKLIDSSDELQFRSRTHESLSDGGIFGTSVTKTIWEEKIIVDWECNLVTGEYRQTPRVIRQGTLPKVINLAKFLPDPDATNSDVADWSGVGDRTTVSYDLLKNRFGKDGPYNLNKDAFFAEWPEQGDKLSTEDAEEIKADKRAREQTLEGEATFLKVWEWHGEIHFSDRAAPTECVCTVITGLQAKDPRTGILVRLREAPALRLGKRPYLVYPFTPTASWHGIGLIEANLDVIWYLSHCVNLFVDVVRFTSIPIIKALSSAAFLANRDDEGNIVWTPGMVLECTSRLDEIGEFALTVPQLSSLVDLIQYLERMLEKRTAVSDATRGVSETRKTATESHNLQLASQMPIAEKLDLFAECFLNPYGEIALSNFAQHIREDQQIWVRGMNGIPEPRMLTVQEISAGQYVVKAALDIEDSAKISKAQTAIQLLQTLQNYEMPLLLNERKKTNYGPIIESIANALLDIDADLILEEVDEPTQQQLLAQKQPPPPPPPPPSTSFKISDLPVEGQVQLAAQAGINLTPEDYMMIPDMMEQFGAGGSAEPMGQGPSGPLPGMMTAGNQGGPIGPTPSSLNEMFQRMQMNAQSAGPVQPGMTGPA